ncbi:GGDEF domain-containing protein [Marinobacterium arenosum]|uniref:GGDEF domain-containing protein n=1 Tax=Marinobacterium arenosum TaxID=2862496 RepID=UPI001C97C56D|nr:sensor domain-containing diguanylate cyclase [Marinobacterium arenosum]MBY4677978.1 sensor domain-containing diguanylate cyclase [Marinobacterium arenosum]
MNDIDVATLTELCPDPVIGVDRRGIITIFNPAAEQLLQYRSDEVVDRMSIVDIYGSFERARAIRQLMDGEQFGRPGHVEGYETELIGKDGRAIPIRLSAALVDLGDGVLGSIGFFHDLTARKQLEARLRELSVTDDLTGLHNQRHFYEMVESELERSRRYRRAFALICIDLDNFKQVNDRLGHLEGDRVLRFIGQVVKRDLRTADQAFRYGGDEFMILLPETDLSAAQRLAERLRNRFNEYSPYGGSKDASERFEISLSIGVTDTDGYETVEDLINRADKAMYVAKQAGGDRAISVAK